MNFKYFSENNYTLFLESPDQTIDPAELRAADTLTLKLGAALVNIFQFQIVPDKQIDKAEQIRWQINAVLDQPLENYFLDYQVFKETETEILGLACVIEKEKLNKIMANLREHNPNIQKVCSEDEQFVLYREEICFWQKQNLLQTLNKIILIFLIGGGLLLSTGGLVLRLAWRSLADEKNTAEKQVQVLEQKLDRLNKARLLAKTTLGNKNKNKKYYQVFYKLTAKAPEHLFFSQLEFSAKEKVFRLAGFAADEMEQINYFVKQLKTCKELESVSLTKTSAAGARVGFELQAKLKRELKPKNSMTQDERGAPDNNG